MYVVKCCDIELYNSRAAPYRLGWAPCEKLFVDSRKQRCSDFVRYRLCTTHTCPLNLFVPLAKKLSPTIEMPLLLRIWQVSIWGFQPDGMREVEWPGCRTDASCEEMHLTRLGRVLSGALFVQLVNRTEIS